MRHAVSTTRSPLDYNLEAVLPGVHQRLASLESHMCAHDTKFSNLTTHISEERKRTVETIGDGLEAFADTIRKRRATQQSNGRTGSTQQQTNGELLDELHRVSQHRMVANPSSVEDLYNEFYGLHSFKDVPIEGGIAAVEEKYGGKWRKGWKGSAKYLSRVRIVMKGIQVLKEEAGDDALNVAHSLPTCILNTAHSLPICPLDITHPRT